MGLVVTHLTLKNWRNFQDVDVHLNGRVFLVGPNASGKSNLLDAFRFLRDIAKPGGGLQTAISSRGSLSKIRCLAARRYPHVEIAVALSAWKEADVLWRYEIGMSQQQTGKHLPVLTYERVYHGAELICSRPDKSDREDQLRLTQTHLEQIGSNQRFRELAQFFRDISYMHVVPQLIRHPDAFTGPGMPGDPYGQNLLDTIARTSPKTRASRLGRIERALRVAVPQLKQLTETQDATGKPHLEAIYEHWRSRGAKQQEDQFSDGTLRLLGLLWSLLESDSLLLLEEPELSLNSAIVAKLPALMSRLQRQRRRQIMVSTHSADLLREKGIGGEDVLLLQPQREGTVVQVASSQREIRELLEQGVSAADAILPHVAPSNLSQLTLDDLFR